jgi:hypothetical protein
MNKANVVRALLLALSSSPTMSEEISRTFTYTADLTGDGRNEKIVLAIHGAAINKPFRWSLSVTDEGGHSLLKVEKDDAWIDEAYGDPSYMLGCTGYEQCKRLYYFEQKPKEISDCLKSGGTQHLAKVIGSENYSEAVRAFLAEKKSSPSAIEAALKELKLILEHPKTASLCYSEHEQDHGQYLVWLKSVGGFVPYHVE